MIYRGFTRYFDEFVAKFSDGPNIYEYFLNKKDLDKVNFLATKSVFKALNLAKENSYRTLKNNKELKDEPQQNLFGKNAAGYYDTEPKFTEEEFKEIQRIILKEISIDVDKKLLGAELWPWSANSYELFISSGLQPRGINGKSYIVDVPSESKIRKTVVIGNYLIKGYPTFLSKHYQIEIRPLEKKQASYPDKPDEIVINSEYFSQPIRELDIYNYYQGIKEFLVPDTFTNDVVVFSFDLGKKTNFKDCKEAVKDCLKFKFKYDEIFKKEYEIRFDGNKSFNLYAYLKKKNNILDAKEALKEHLKDMEKYYIDISISNANESHVAPYSMRTETGLVCLPLDRSKLDDFKKEDAKFDEVYHKLTRLRFVWSNLKKSSAYLKVLAKINILTEPSKHELPELFEELKFGRPKVDQDYLDQKIEELEPMTYDEYLDEFTEEFNNE